MSASPPPFILSSASPAQAGELALRLAHAEQALRALTLGQADAIVDADGQTYLLRPAQERLRENERRLRTILEGMPDAVMVVSRAGLILSLEGAVARVLGYEPQRLIGHRFLDLVHESNAALVHAAFFSVIEGLQELASVEFLQKADDGTFRRIEATLRKLPDVEWPGVIFNFRPSHGSGDLRFQCDQRELASEKASVDKDRFLAMLSHELRTPLNPVLLGVYELEQDERFTEARETLALIRRCLEVESGLLDELIDFTTLGQHKVRLRPAVLDIHEAIPFVLKICASELAASQIELQLDLQARDHWVVADADRLQQIMWNLVKNAVKFPPRRELLAPAHHERAAGRIDPGDHGRGHWHRARLIAAGFQSIRARRRCSAKPLGRPGSRPLHRQRDGETPRRHPLRQERRHRLRHDLPPHPAHRRTATRRLLSLIHF